MWLSTTTISLLLDRRQTFIAMLIVNWYNILLILEHLNHNIENGINSKPTNETTNMSSPNQIQTVGNGANKTPSSSYAYPHVRDCSTQQLMSRTTLCSTIPTPSLNSRQLLPTPRIQCSSSAVASWRRGADCISQTGHHTYVQYIQQ